VEYSSEKGIRTSPMKQSMRDDTSKKKGKMSYGIAA
jgi:hypothetical protein